MNKIYNDLFNLNPRYSTSISFILGLVLINNLDTVEQNMLGNWIILLGQAILTNASAQNVLEARIKGGRININSKEIKSLYNPVIYDLNTIHEIIDKMYPDHEIDLNIITDSINELKKQIDELKKISY